MALHDSILNTVKTSKLVEKVQEHYVLPRTSVIHIDTLRVMKEKQFTCTKSLEIFVLTDNHLFFLIGEPTIDKKSVSFKTKAKIELKWVLCHFEVKQYNRVKKYCIELIKNNKRVTCDVKSKEKYDVWVEVLRLKTINMNFEHQYKIEAPISMNKRAKLSKVTDSSSGQVYFAHVEEKTSLIGTVMVEKVRRHIKGLKKLKGHGGVVQIRDVCETIEAVYIIVEPYFGGPVFNYSCKYTMPTFLKLLRNVLAVIRLLEVKGIRHRRIRPLTIYFKHANKSFEHNEIILVDFSHSKISRTYSKESSVAARRLPIVVGSNSGFTQVNSDNVDLGLIALNYLYYAQYNEPLEHSTNLHSVLYNSNFMLPVERNIKS